MWPNKSVVAVHSIEAMQSTNFKGTIVLTRMTEYMDHLVMEATEIQLHPNNFHIDNGFYPSCSWYLATNKIRYETDSAPHSPCSPGTEGRQLCIKVQHVNTTYITSIPDDGDRDVFEMSDTNSTLPQQSHEKTSLYTAAIKASNSI